MKKAKTKPEEAPEEGVPPTAFIETEETRNLQTKLGGHPTTQQLAMIAATLARNTSDTAEELVNQAMKLWLTARNAIFADYWWERELESQNKEMQSHVEHWVNLWSNIPKCDNYFRRTPDGAPVTRDQFFGTMLPQCRGRSADVARIAKLFIRDVLRDENGKEPSQDDVADAYGKWKPFGTGEANAMAKRFEEWHHQHIREGRRRAALKSVQVRQKRKARPPYKKLKAALLT